MGFGRRDRKEGRKEGRKKEEGRKRKKEGEKILIGGSMGVNDLAVAVLEKIRGMKRIEEVLFAAWGKMGLVKTRQVIVDTTPQPKDIAYPTDADLLYRARKKIVKVVERVRGEVTLRKPFRTFARVGKKTLITVKKFYRQNREKGKEGVEKLKAMTSSVVKQAEKLVKSLYGRGRKDLARSLNKAVSQGRKIVTADGTGVERGEGERENLLPP